MVFDKSSYGMNGFFWFFGVVEDRKDPLNCGRVRVRCYYWNNEDPTQVPVEDLPWAQVVMPVSSASVSGVGHSPTGIVEGSTVFGFFVDGLEAQMPMIIGTVPAIPAAVANYQIGFNDPRTDTQGFPKYVLGNTPRTFPAFADEPDANRLARNENIDQTINSFKVPVDQIVSASGTSISQPSDPYNAKYPFNHVYQSESGHTIEVDDTPDAERIHIFHRSGTRVEIFPDGSIVTIGKNNSYTAIDGNGVEHVKGTKDVVVDGNATLKINDMTIQVTGGDYKLSVDSGNATLTINGNLNMNITGDVSETIGGNLTRNVSGSINESASSITYNTPSISASGTIVATGNVTGAGISLQTHSHVGVRSGGDVSGPPI